MPIEPSSASADGEGNSFPPQVWGIVVAAGVGRRFGAEKQFLSLAGRPVHLWSLEAARSVATGVVLVVPAGREGDPELLAAADHLAAGGETRAASVRAGLRLVPEDADIVVVHDAVRPMASPELFRAVVEAIAAGADGAVPTVPVSDTLKRVEGGVISATVDRTNLVRAQTPQAFRASALRRAHAGGAEATDDAALVETAGGRVVAVAGEDTNLKITSPEDLALVEWRLSFEPATGRST